MITDCVLPKWRHRIESPAPDGRTRVAVAPLSVRWS